MEEMPSQFVDVKQQDGQGRFWRGADVELQAWEEAKRREQQRSEKAAKAAAERERKRAAGESQGRPASTWT